MKRITLLLSMLLLLPAVSAVPSPEKMMSVTVKETIARETPSFLGKIVVTLHYADRLQILEEKSGWARASLPGLGKAGWVHLSALTAKRIVLQAGAADVEQSASSGEVALAGKGFNQEVEAQYRQNSNMDYTWVDQMEQYTVTTEQIISFLEDGQLTSVEEGKL